MGTRADFYVGIGPDAEWLGSLAWDGHVVFPDMSAKKSVTFGPRSGVMVFSTPKEDR